jgi:chromate reductase, NAD(P)H dehydrogenase (quinone)
LTVRLLAISGSLRARSSNTAALSAAARLAPEGVAVVLYDGLAELPHFNPDLDHEGMQPPAAVAALRSLVESAGGLLFSTPEYAHGLPGSLKNALDWLVSAPAFYGKPVAIVDTSAAYAVHAVASLVEILSTMGTRLVREACLDLPLRGRLLDVDGIVADADLASALRRGLAAFVRSIEAR